MNTHYLIRPLLCLWAIGYLSTLGSCISGEQCVECVPDLTETVTIATLYWIPTDNPTDTIRATLNDPSIQETLRGTGEVVLLKANTNYQMHLDMWNEQRTPSEHVAQNVRNEGTAHQIFYTVPPILDLQLQYADVDTSNNPIGLTMNAQTGNASSDTLSVLMMLEVYGKDNSPETGDEEMDIRFPIVIQP
ncbi:MAG: hypothetical protein IPL33_02820 [Sphingobacteriales bacterium]|nr:hypothetical protein [Sphingobacteriales bacterium]